MALSDNLVAYWSLEADGTDATGRGNTLAVSSSRGFVAGKVGNAIDLERTNVDYLYLADNADLSMGDIDCTFVTWGKVESNPSVALFLSKWALDTPAAPYAHKEYWLGAIAGVVNAYVSGDGSAQTGVASTAGAMSAGSWYMVAMKHDATANTIGICVNAGAWNTAAHTTGIYNGQSTFNLGRSPGGGGSAQLWDGLLDETGIWKRALSDAEITWLYNSGAGRSYSDIVAGMPGVGLPVIAWEHARIFGA